MNLLNYIVIMLGVISFSSVFAQDSGDPPTTSAAPSFPCEELEQFRDFDFWVGSWDVHLADGTFAGSNVIAQEQRGCVLTENWTGAQGSTGMSINYLDAAKGEWVQVWHAASGYQIDIRGGLTPDGMHLNGSIHYVKNEQTLPFRGLWTALPDGRVRQFFEISQDDGETWATWFEGFYTRKKAE